ncbi:MAG: tetratricopeptide repeat protein [Bernardetiaceae bacterium]
MKQLLFVCIFWLSLPYLLHGQGRAELEAQLAQAQGRQRVDILNQLSLIYTEIATEDSGRVEAEEAIRLAKGIEYNEGLAQAHYALGQFYAFQSQFIEALEQYQKGMQIARNTGQAKLMISLYTALAYIYSELGNYSKALDYTLQALRLMDDLPDKSEVNTAQIFEGLSFIYEQLGNLSEARAYAVAALSADSARGDTVGYALGINNLGEIYKLEKNYDKALELYQQALQIVENHQEKTALVRYMYSGIGEVLTLQGKADQAIPYLRDALELNNTYDDSEGIVHDSDLMSRAHLQQKNYPEALRYAQQAKEGAIALQLQDQLRQIYQQLSNIHAATNNYPEAFAYQRKYAELSDQIYQDNATRHLAEMKAEYDLDKKEEEILLLNERQRQQELLIRQQTTQTRFLIALSLLGLALIFVLFFRFREKQYANKVLESQKHQIEEQNQNLARLNAIANQQKEEIEAQNKILASKNEEIERKQGELQRTYQDLNRSHAELTQTHEQLSQTARVLDETNFKLAHSYGQIRSSITYAKRIQEAMLPDHQQIAEGFDDFFVLFKPRDIVSGDFYWYAKVNQQSVLVVADCTGHGVPGAIMSMLGNAYLNQIIVNQQLVHPGEILERLHQNISTALRQQQTENKDGMDATVLVWDKTTGIVQFAGAKNPLVYVKDGQMVYLKGDRTMIGGFSRRTDREPFHTHTITVDAPTYFYMFSDGFHDQFGGSDGTKFMSKRFRQLLANTRPRGRMEDQCQQLVSVFEQWQGDHKQLDDVLVVGLKLLPKNADL